MRRTFLPVLLGLPLMTIPYAEPAHACTPSIPGFIWGREVIPYEGRTNVPTNARILVRYSYSSTTGAIDRLQLRSPDGFVALAPSDSPFILIPAQALQPRTQYQVLSDIAQLPCMQDARNATLLGQPLCTTVTVGDAGVTNAREPDGGSLLDTGTLDGGEAIDADGQTGPYVIATFTTGDGPDLTAPTAAGTVSSQLYPDSCSGGGCCTEYSGYRAVLSWSGFSDDMGVATYEVSVQGASAGASVTSTTTSAQILCSGYGPDFLSTFAGVSGVYQVVAVDFAGNRSAPITTTVSVPCGTDAGVDGPGTSDAAVSAAPIDGPPTGQTGTPGAGGASGGAHDTPSSGCACALGTSKRQGIGATAMLALTVLLFFRRRQRSGPRRRPLG